MKQSSPRYEQEATRCQLGLELLGNPPVTDMRIKWLYLENKNLSTQSQQKWQNLTNMGSYCVEIIGAVCVSQSYYQNIETVDPKKSEFPKESYAKRRKRQQPDGGTYLSERNFTQFCKIRLKPTSQWVNSRTHTLLKTTWMCTILDPLFMFWSLFRTLKTDRLEAFAGPLCLSF